MYCSVDGHMGTWRHYAVMGVVMTLQCSHRVLCHHTPIMFIGLEYEMFITTDVWIHI